MLTPEYLAATPDALVELYGKIEQDILANMAERIAKYDYYIPAVQHQHQRLRAMGMLETENFASKSCEDSQLGGTL